MRSTQSFSAGRLSRSFFGSAWLWGLAGTAAVYALIPSLPVGRELVTRYTCGHPLEYALTALFVVGLTILLKKLLGIGRERHAFVLAGEFPRFSRESANSEVAADFATHVDQLPASSLDTYWGRRLQYLKACLGASGAKEDFSSQLNYLTDADANQLQESYSLLQTIVWAIPILGFLGTVMGITLAIANVTPEQLESSLDQVTGGLGVAFDTTALALTYSLFLVFGTLFVKRAEEQFLSRIDEHCRLEVQAAFPRERNEISNPLLDAQQAAATTLLQESRQLTALHSQTWSTALSEMRAQWTAALQQERQDLANVLQQDTEQLIEDHTSQLAESRNAFQATQLAAQTHLLEGLEKFLAAQQTQSERLQTHETTVLQALDGQILNWQQMTEGWQLQLAEMNDASLKHAEQLQQLAERLEQITDLEGTLVRLQGDLNRNLDSLHVAETFDEALHNLTAAVHMLTGRVRGRDAA